MAAYNYSIIVKALSIDEAIDETHEWLSYDHPTETRHATELGYGEVMLSIPSERNLDEDLHEWSKETRPADGTPFQRGALIWWQK